MFDHYIAVDWSQKNMAIARMTAKSNQVTVLDVPSSVKDLRVYLENLKGRKILTFEESAPAQWLYTELRSSVDEVLVCDPYRNRLLMDGPKNDRIDAEKMVRLLRANLIKPVFHTCDEFIELRKIVSGYEDLVKAGVRLQNQRLSLLRSNGLGADCFKIEDKPSDQFVLHGLQRGIAEYESEKRRYEAEIKRLAKKNLQIKALMSIPGIAEINALRILARVVDATRFPNRNHFLSYCGLIKHERLSGGRSYGRRTPRYSRTLKYVFKTAAMVTTKGNSSDSPMKKYYDYLIQEKGYPDYQAKHAVARRIATLAYGVLKEGRKFDEGRELKETTLTS